MGDGWCFFSGIQKYSSKKDCTVHVLLFCDGTGALFLLKCSSETLFQMLYLRNTQGRRMKDAQFETVSWEVWTELPLQVGWQLPLFLFLHYLGKSLTVLRYSWVVASEGCSLPQLWICPSAQRLRKRPVYTRDIWPLETLKQKYSFLKAILYLWKPFGALSSSGNYYLMTG